MLIADVKHSFSSYESFKKINVLNKDFGDISMDKYFQEGMKVKIKHGQFVCLEGVVITKCNKSLLEIKVDGLSRAFSFEISEKSAIVVDA